jgi:hypothetical protein
MPVATTDLRFTRGQPKGWHRTSSSGAKVVAWFCGECGARLYGEREGPSGFDDAARGHARRHVMAGAGGAFVHAQRSGMGGACEGRPVLEEQPAPAEFRAALAAWRSRFLD